MPTTHIIIGTSAAGLSAALTLRKCDPVCEIICISDEVELPYNKCRLISYLRDSNHNPYTARLEFLKENRITLLLGVRVVRIDPAQKSVFLSTGETLFFTSLCISAGASPIIPHALKQQNLKNVFTMHSLADVHAMQVYMARKEVKCIAIIGAGLTGIESADACARLGYDVVVIDQGQRGLQSITDDYAWKVVQERLEQKGVIFYWRQSIDGVQKNREKADLILTSGGVVQADMVIIAAGVRANSTLAMEAGIKLERGIIVTTPSMETSVPAIYAAGDVALVPDLITGSHIPSCLWPEAVQQGRVAGANMAGKADTFPGILRITKSEICGISLASCGPVASWRQEVIIKNEGDGYAAYLNENGVLKGFLTLGGDPDLAELRRLVLTREPIHFVIHGI